MDNGLKYRVKFHHFLQLAICLILGTYGLVTGHSEFGLFAVVFVPVIYVGLLIGLVLDWFDWSWC